MASDDNPLDGVPVFLSRIARKLDKGSQEFGNSGFTDTFSPFQLLDEIEEELIDVCGWSYLLLHRVQRIRTKFGGRVMREILEDTDE